MSAHIPYEPTDAECDAFIADALQTPIDAVKPCHEALRAVAEYALIRERGQEASCIQ